MLFAQVSSGSLLGDARDEKARLRWTRCHRGSKQRHRFHAIASTNAFGSYRIDDLLPGAYTVTAQHDGFQAVTVSPIFVEVNQKVRLDFDLQVGSVHDTATVTAHASPLQTDEASEGYTAGLEFLRGAALAGPQHHRLGDARAGRDSAPTGRLHARHHERPAGQSRRGGVECAGERRAVHRATATFSTAPTTPIAILFRSR